MSREKTKKIYPLIRLLVIAQSAALGFAAKPFISALAGALTGPLMIPGGSLLGGLYMMFVIIPAGLLPRPGTAALTGLLQGVMATATGIGSHGLMTVFSYALPGVAIDIVMLLSRIINKKSGGTGLLPCFISGMASNMTGTYIVNRIIFSLPPIPLLLTLFSALLSGGIGGLLAYNIIKPLKKIKILGSS